jgi:hypothetical protein
VFLRNVGIYLESYTVSKPRTSESEDKMPVQQYVCFICDLYCDLCESVAETKQGAVKVEN